MGKKTILFFLFCFNIISYLPLSASEMTEQWELVWSDEFNGTGAPDYHKWMPEHGMQRNQEEQAYTSDLKNCRVENGQLIITAHKEKIKNVEMKKNSTDFHHAEFAEFSSASLLSRDAFRYGRIEVMAKIPTGKGSWPAIWMLGDNGKKLESLVGRINWPECGEIDIMENVGCEPDNIHATIHYPSPYPGNLLAKNSNTYKADRPFDGFHRYALEWDEKEMRFFYDDDCFHTVVLDEIGKGDANPFRKPFFLILNLAVGGSWGGIVDHSIFPLEYRIDYVRIYQKKTEPVQK